MRHLHHWRAAAVAPAEARRRVGPEPVALAGLAVERRRAVAVGRRPETSHSALVHDIHRDMHAARACPGDVDVAERVRLLGRADRDAWQLDRRESRRATDPEIAHVLAPWVWIRASPAIRIDRPAAVHLVHAEVQVRPGRGARHARDADDLTAIDVLPLVDPDVRHVPVESEQAVAVIDLDGLSGKTGVAAGDKPVREYHAARR